MTDNLHTNSGLPTVHESASYDLALDLVSGRDVPRHDMHVMADTLTAFANGRLVGPEPSIGEIEVERELVKRAAGRLGLTISEEIQ